MVLESKKNTNPKLNSFFFFLFLATIFWLLTKFSEDAEANLTTSIIYKNIPEAVILNNDSVKELSFDVSGNGFQILSYKLRKSKLEIDLSPYINDVDTIISISSQEIQKLILDQLSFSQIKNLSQSELKIHLDKNKSKKVPIILKSQIAFKDGYFQQGEVILKPDSVRVSGPSEAIDTISAIPTKLLKKQNVSEGFNETIDLVKPKNKFVNIDITKVEVIIDSEEFSQMTIKVPVEVVNIPADVSLKLFPEVIEITFDVSIEDFGYLSKDDFKIECDYNNRIEDGSFMIPKLVKSPSILQHVELETKKIQYLIFK